MVSLAVCRCMCLFHFPLRVIHSSVRARFLSSVRSSISSNFSVSCQNQDLCLLVLSTVIQTCLAWGCTVHESDNEWALTSVCIFGFWKSQNDTLDDLVFSWAVVGWCDNVFDFFYYISILDKNASGEVIYWRWYYSLTGLMLNLLILSLRYCLSAWQTLSNFISSLYWSVTHEG